MRYFLIQYDQRAGRLLRIDEYPAEQATEATAARTRLEGEHLSDPNIEVIVLTAEDRSALEATHSRYFKRVDELASGDSVK